MPRKTNFNRRLATVRQMKDPSKTWVQRASFDRGVIEKSGRRYSIFADDNGCMLSNAISIYPSDRTTTRTVDRSENCASLTIRDLFVRGRRTAAGGREPWPIKCRSIAETRALLCPGQFYKRRCIRATLIVSELLCNVFGTRIQSVRYDYGKARRW